MNMKNRGGSRRQEIVINPDRAGRFRSLSAMPILPVLLLSLLITVGLAVLPVSPARATGTDYFDLQHRDERTTGDFSIKDEATGRVILTTARVLHEGDQYIDSGNECYLVTRIEQDTAWARIRRGEEGGETLEGQAGGTGTAIPERQEKEAVGIYHSHGAESYVPSDGTDSNDTGGGIIEVGRSFQEALRNRGITVKHVQETHVPHDAGAYNRSRRTAINLVEDNLDAIFDVHRDAVPAEAYDRDIDGRELVQIMMVIGRQNQNMGNNKSFAEGLKQVADSNHPGLIKGILLAHGNYNQDLSPRSILLEVGGHENSRRQAEQSIALFADVVDTYLYAQQGRARGGGIAFQGTLKLLIALLLALFIYMLISAGSWKEMKRKVFSFFQREFADLGRGFKGKIKPEDDEPDS